MLTKPVIKVTLKDIERNLSAYLRRVQSGESLVITDNGKPVAEVTPAILTATSPRPYGLCAGEFSVPADFDAPLPDDLLADFEGK